MARTIGTVGQLEKHEPSGQFYNWYDPKTLEKLTTWPESGDEVQPFMSSVDNGWLATGLLLAARAEPRLADEADAIREDMDFGCYYNEAEGQGGQIRGGFWDEDFGDAARVKGDYCGMGEDVWYTGHHYGAFNTEPRMASYLGIASGQIPQKHYFGTFRTFPATPATGLRPSEADRRVEDLRGRRRLRGRARLPRHEGRPHLGRQHVRGADGAAVRARGDVGQALVGRQPPALRAGRRSSTA